MKQIFLLLLILPIGCLKQSEPVLSEKMIYIYPTLDSVYDLALQNDTLYVANGELGFKVFKISADKKVVMNSLYEGLAFSEEENIINIEHTSEFAFLFFLDKFNFTYVRPKVSIFDQNFSEMKAQSNCYNYHSKSTILKNNSSTPSILTLNRKIDQFDENNRNTSIGLSEFEGHFEYGYIDKNCSLELLESLSYELSDIDFENERLFLSNPNKDIPSIQVYDENIGTFSLAFEDTLLVKPITIRAYENAYVVGLDNKAGCYIALLDVNGNLGDSESKFNFAEGYTIRDVHYSNSLLTLSAGYGGVLVYDWDGESIPTPRAMISSGYAYTSLVFDHNKIIVGTKNGIKIYEI